MANLISYNGLTVADTLGTVKLDRGFAQPIVQATKMLNSNYESIHYSCKMGPEHTVTLDLFVTATERTNVYNAIATAADGTLNTLTLPKLNNTVLNRCVITAINSVSYDAQEYLVPPSSGDCNSTGVTKFRTTFVLTFKQINP